MPMSNRILMKKREYSRCRIACSTPPTYRSTGAQRRTASTSNGPCSYLGEQYRRKYQDESTKVSMVSVSRLAGPPHLGHSVLTQSDAAASGETPRGARSWPRRSGRTTGSCSSGTGTSPQPSQYTIGMGVPQNRCLDTSQSRSRKLTAARPLPCPARISVILAMAATLSRPLIGPEFISVPSPEVAMPVSAGSAPPVSTTGTTGRP